jgi:hypothetical protein
MYVPVSGRVVSSQDPMSYLDKYGIAHERLEEQLIPTHRAAFALENYEGFLAERAQRLASQANAFLDVISKSS